MKTVLKTVFAIALALTFAVTAFASEYTKGTVKKVNTKTKKVTIIHEELKNLEMPAMTMVFGTLTPEMLEMMKAGDEIKFVAERVKGKLTVIELKE